MVFEVMYHGPGKKTKIMSQKQVFIEKNVDFFVFHEVLNNLHGKYSREWEILMLNTFIASETLLALNTFIALETLLTLNTFIASETLHSLLSTALTAAVMSSKLTFFVWLVFYCVASLIKYIKLMVHGTTGKKTMVQHLHWSIFSFLHLVFWYFKRNQIYHSTYCSMSTITSEKNFRNTNWTGLKICVNTSAIFFRMFFRIFCDQNRLIPLNTHTRMQHCQTCPTQRAVTRFCIHDVIAQETMVQLHSTTVSPTSSNTCHLAAKVRQNKIF